MILNDPLMERNMRVQNYQILAHNITIDKIEVIDKVRFLSCHPYELPCQSLFFALLIYELVLNSCFNCLFQDQMIKSYELKNVEFVHLSNIKENFSMDTSAPLMPTFCRAGSALREPYFKGF